MGVVSGQSKQDSTILNYLLDQHKIQFETVGKFEKYVLIIQYKTENAKLQKIIDMIREEQLKLNPTNKKTTTKGTWR